MKWSPEHFLEQCYDDVTPQYRFQAKSEQDWRTWRQELKARLIDLIGAFPAREVELAPTSIEEQDVGEYIRQRIVFRSLPNLEVPAYVLIPKQRQQPGPAVVALHGHGYGSKAIVGLRPDGSENTDCPDYQHNFAVELVKRGFVVIAPELLGFGDRRLKEMEGAEPGENACYRISTQLLLLGKTMPGIRVYETMRAIDYLLQRDDVDPNRIGCMGISGGGLVGSFAAAIDERIKVSVISGYANTFKGSIMPMRHCLDNYVPRILQYAEMPDIIGLIAPRPLLLESGTEDPIFPIQTSKEAYAHIREIYQLLQAENKLDIDIFEGKHQISGRIAYRWFEQWL